MFCPSAWIIQAEKRAAISPASAHIEAKHGRRNPWRVRAETAIVQGLAQYFR
jgi:hypothetical protein